MSTMEPLDPDVASRSYRCSSRTRIPWWMVALLVLRCATGQDEAFEAMEAVEPPAPPPEFLCPVKDHGAVGDGVAYDTAPIQAAIDACARNQQGGVVVFEEDKQYLSAQLVVSSGVRLRLPKSSSLLAGPQRADYPKKFEDWYFILFQSCQNCGIEGGGRIDGQGSLSVFGGTQEHKTVRTWMEQSCGSQEQCKPHLVGVRDSYQVSFEGVEFYDSVHYAVHVLRSQAVALLNCSIWGDPLIPASSGVVIDGSRRVYLGDCTISTADNAVGLKTTEADKPVEFVLVDGGVLQSRSAAIQIGGETRGAFSTLVFQNITIQQSHRGLSISLRDEGSVEGVQFTNISVDTIFYERYWWGAAEPIHITAMPRDISTAVGTISDVRFTNITATAEAGIVIAGCPESTIDGVVFDNITLELVQQTEIAGGFLDYRPGIRNIVDDVSTSAVLVEFANHADIKNLKVVWGKPARPEWGQALEITPHTVHALSMESFFVHDESAHPKGAEEHVGLAHGLMMQWVRKIEGNLRSGAGAFLPLEQNAAKGVLGRRAASSASALLIALMALVITVLVVATACDMVLKRRLKGHPKFEKVASA